MKNKSVKTLVVFACALALTCVAHAQTIKGTITDPSGAVIAGATVKLQAADRLLAETTTDSRGSYSLQAEKGTACKLTVSAAGFRELSRTVQPRPGDLQLSLQLQVAAQEEQVSVEATRQIFRDQLDMNEVRDTPAKDVGEALAAVDGVWKIRKGGIANDLVVRGLQQGNINVLIDGARIFGACPGHMDPPAQHVDFSEVERVDVLKGPYDVANQGTLGALVNVVTKSPGPGFHVKPSLSVGSSGYFNPSAIGSYADDRFNLLLGYSYRQSDPYKDGSGRSVTAYSNYTPTGRDRSAFDINTGWFDAGFAPTPNQKISLAYTRQASGMVLYPYLTMDSDYDRADRATFKYHFKDVSDKLKAVRIETYFTQVQHYMSDRLRASAIPGSWKMASDASTRAIGGRIETDLGRDFTFGVESYYRNWNMFGFMNMGMSVLTSNSLPDVNTQTVGSFLDYRHALTDRFRISGGLRFDHATTAIGPENFNTDLYYLYHNTRSTRNENNYPSANLRLTAKATKSVELFAGVGTTARIPDAEERYINRKSLMGANMGNPILPETRNTEVDTGVTLSRGASYIKPTLFYSNLSNYIIVNEQPRLNMPAPGVMLPAKARSYQNIDARMYGGEISYALALPRSLSFSGGTSYTRGIGDPKPQFGILSTNLPEMPPLRSWAALRYASSIAFAEIGGVAVSRQNRVNTDLTESPTPGYGTMNMKLGINYKKLYASFAVDNLLNRFYYEHLSYYRDPDYAGVKVPEPGRNFFGQLKYTF